MLFVGLVKLAECAKIPSQGPTVWTRIEAADDPQPTGHLSQLPGKMAMAAQHLRIEFQSFFCLPRSHGMGDRFFNQVERGLIGRQTQARAPDKADQLLADQMVPEASIRSCRQPAEVIPHGGMDADRAIVLAQGQMSPYQRFQGLAKRVGIEQRERTTRFPFALVKAAISRARTAEPDASRRTAAILVSPAGTTATRPLVSGRRTCLPLVCPRSASRIAASGAGGCLNGSSGCTSKLVVTGDQLAKPFLILPRQRSLLGRDLKIGDVIQPKKLVNVVLDVRRMLFQQALDRQFDALLEHMIRAGNRRLLKSVGDHFADRCRQLGHESLRRSHRRA